MFGVQAVLQATASSFPLGHASLLEKMAVVGTLLHLRVSRSLLPSCYYPPPPPSTCSFDAWGVPRRWSTWHCSYTPSPGRPCCSPAPF